MLFGTHFIRENRDSNTRFSLLFNEVQLYINSENDLKIYEPFTFYKFYETKLNFVE